MLRGFDTLVPRSRAEVEAAQRREPNVPPCTAMVAEERAGAFECNVAVYGRFEGRRESARPPSESEISQMYDQIQIQSPPVPVARSTRYLSMKGIIERGWTRTMIDSLLGQPDEEWANPYYRSAPPCRMFLQARVEAAEATTEFAARIEKVNARRSGKDYTPTFVRKYGTTAAALAEAAEGLFALNRYAKHATCSMKHKSEIYALKNRFIRWAVENGYLQSWGRHEIVQPEKVLECYCVSRCSGNGCHRCDFTGVHRRLPERTLEFVVLRFAFGGKAYSWHQPEESVLFAYAGRAPQLDDASDWTPERDKPVDMPRSRFALVKALLRWVLADAEEVSS